MPKYIQVTLTKSGNYYIEMSLELQLKVRQSYQGNCINKSAEAGMGQEFVGVCTKVSLSRQRARCLERKEMIFSKHTGNNRRRCLNRHGRV